VELGLLLRELGPFQATLVGTFPLGLQGPGSDFDIICCRDDLGRFEAVLAGAAGGGRLESRRLPLVPEASVTSLQCQDVPVEVFCQPLSVHRQHAFRHMIVEGRLLSLSDALRARVIELRRTGLKTEPAFARALGLAGDPHAAVLALELCSNAQLEAVLRSAGLR
jgi:hypothetical protein